MFIFNKEVVFSLLSIGPFVIFVFQHDYAKTTEQICWKIGGRTWAIKEAMKFWCRSGQGADPVFHLLFLIKNWVSLDIFDQGIIHGS